MRLAIACVFALAGCLGSDTTVCRGGGVCPAGLACVVDDLRGADACAAAAGFVDGERCTLCVIGSCGDGVLDSGESCDDGNLASGDGCPATCGPSCGDGLVDPGEACDDRNLVGGDGCSANCRSSESCGDGVLNEGEGCDNGNVRDGDGCSATCVAEQPTWARLEAEPSPREHAAVAYDARRGRVVLFGGRDLVTGGRLGDTWEWDGTTWTERVTTAGGPGSREGHAMAYDAARRRIVLFGGVGLADTWEWDGASWLARSTTIAPPVRGFAAMAYDAARREVVLFGGCIGEPRVMCGAYGDTWVWNGTRWAQRAPAVSPSPRNSAALAFDPRRGRLVLLGGYVNSVGGAVADIWEWDGAAWTPSMVMVAPPARYGAALTYDVRRGRLVLFGGLADVGGAGLHDTWDFDGVTWQRRELAETPPAGSPVLAYDVAHGVTVLFVGLASAPATWVDDGTGWRALRADHPRGRTSAAMAYDPSTRRTLMFGGVESDPFVPLSDTWVRSGTSWAQVTTGPTPAGRRSHALAADPNGGFMMFGGEGVNGALDDTWVWRGSWFRQTPPTRPSARRYHAMAYDELRHRVVLFGGATATGLASETWEWDGNTWTEAQPTTVPPARWRHALTYDRARGRVVMFGGLNRRDTWEWDGTDWQERTPAGPAPPDAGIALAYDSLRHRTVLFGGCANPGPMPECVGPPIDDVWEWDGATWSLRPASARPRGRGLHAMAFDPALGRVVVFGGTDMDRRSFDDTWEWDGTSWAQRSLAGHPSARTGAAMATDPARARTVLFGGQRPWAGGAEVVGDTWELVDGTWRERSPPLSPAPRYRHALVHDAARARTVLFGGEGRFDPAPLADTWQWDGATWSPAFPAHTPSARSSAAVAYDSTRDLVILFGGNSSVNGENPLDDTWAWNGTDWSLWLTGPPPARLGAAMAYDPRRERLVLFGGRGQTALLDDTWELAGGGIWTRATPATRPPPRSHHAMTFDAARGTVVMFGGTDGSTWEWNGSDWFRLTPTAAPPARTGNAMTYDPLLARTITFGGAILDVEPLDDTWLFSFRTGGGGEACSSGFDGNGNELVGCADPDCAGGCGGCGDGTCDPIEDCHACPGDCGPCDECGDFLCHPGERAVSCPGDCDA